MNELIIGDQIITYSNHLFLLLSFLSLGILFKINASKENEWSCSWNALRQIPGHIPNDAATKTNMSGEIDTTEGFNQKGVDAQLQEHPETIVKYQ